MKKLILFSCVFISAYSFAAETKKLVPQVIEIKATEKGFEPSDINVSAETPVILKITRQSDDTCATEIQIKDKKIKRDLPLNKTVSIDLGKLKKGDTRFACGMNMFKGTIHSN